MDIDKKIFKNIALSDLLNDIYLNTRAKNRKIDATIEMFNTKVKTINDAVIIAPIIREYFDVAVKNDQHLIKLAEIIQRYMIAETKTTGPDSNSDVPAWELSDEEKQALIADMDKALDEAKETLNRPLPGGPGGITNE